jgi:hypothetical protein
MYCKAAVQPFQEATDFTAFSGFKQLFKSKNKNPDLPGNKQLSRHVPLVASPPPPRKYCVNVYVENYCKAFGRFSFFVEHYAKPDARESVSPWNPKGPVVHLYVNKLQMKNEMQLRSPLIFEVLLWGLVAQYKIIDGM